MTNHDAIFRLMLGDRRVIASLLRAYGQRIGIRKGWIKAMDLRTLISLPTDHTSEDLKQRRGDFAWYVKLRKRLNVPPGRGAIIVAEHQSSIHPHMIVRLIGYLNMTEQETEDAIVIVGGKRTPGILIVVHNGKRRWNQSTDSADIYYSLDDEPVGEVLGSLKYFVLDIGALAGQDLPENELMTCLIRQQNAETIEELWDALKEVFRLLPRLRPSQRRTRKGFYEHARSHPLIEDDSDFPSYKSLEHDLLKEGKDVTTVAEANAKRWFKKVRGEGLAKGLAKGLAEGRTMGRAEVQEEAMYLMAAKRFGPETATMLIERFGVPDEPNRLVDIGEWIHECKTGDDLLARAQREWTPLNGVPAASRSDAAPRERKGRGPSRTKGSRSKNSKNRS